MTKTNKTHDEDRQDTWRTQTKHMTKTNKTHDEDTQDTWRRQTKHMTKTNKTHDEDTQDTRRRHTRHMTKTNKTTTKNTTQKTKKMATAKFWSFLYDTQKHNKTWSLLQTTGGKDEPNIVCMRES